MTFIIINIGLILPRFAINFVCCCFSWIQFFLLRLFQTKEIKRMMLSTNGEKCLLGILGNEYFSLKIGNNHITFTQENLTDVIAGTVSKTMYSVTWQPKYVITYFSWLTEKLMGPSKILSWKKKNYHTRVINILTYQYEW